MYILHLLNPTTCFIACNGIKEIRTSCVPSIDAEHMPVPLTFSSSFFFSTWRKK